jgi:hypothetical protein
MESRIKNNPSGARLVHRTAKWRGLLLLLVVNARKFNDGRGSRPKNAVSVRCIAAYGRVFLRAAATMDQRRQQIVAFAHYPRTLLGARIGNIRSLMDVTGGSMRADKFLTALAAVAATTMATLATMTFATAPSKAETVVHVRHHSPARATVHKRSYLDPGTETKRRAEHYSDYYYSPTHGMAPMRNSTLFMNGPALPFIHDRMPFPNCMDLAGFCQ